MPPRISHAFVINMPNSVERYRLFQLESQKTQIPIERLDGVNGQPYVKPGDPPLTAGILGCIKASINAIELAKKRGYKNILIFDDDAELCDDFDQKINAAMSELPKDWVMLRLHISTTGLPKTEDYSNNLLRVYGGNGTYGYVINSKYYDVILKYEVKNFRLPSTVDVGYFKTYDVILQELMPKLPFFQTKERLVYHRDGFSDRMGIHLNFGLGKPQAKPVELPCIKVYYTMHVALHAETLVETLCELGFNASAVTTVDTNDDALYILYCAFKTSKVPKNYIVYQCEQWGSDWFNDRYWTIMRGAQAIWEFGENNIDKYPTELRDNVSFVPPGLVKGHTSAKEIDVLFYGAINNRRSDIINSIRANRINVVYKHDVFGENMRKILSSSKVVLNIHFYENGHLEAFRINEALSCGCHVVSERNSAGFYPEKYKNLVRFGSGRDELVTAIRNALQSTEQKDLSALDNRDFVKAAISKVAKV